MARAHPVTNLGIMPKNRRLSERNPAPSLSELEAPHFQWVRGLLSVCEVTGTEPNSAIQSGRDGGDERVHCTLVWWLVTGLHQHRLRVARWLNSSPRTIDQALNRMRSLARTEPTVHQWVQRLELQSPPTAHRAVALPPPGEAVFMETHSTPRKMGMVALWMTVETGMAPLELWGTEIGTKEAAKWATLWWLFAGKGLTHDEACSALGIHPREALRLLSRLALLAARRPEVLAWMASVRNTTRAVAAT